MENLESLTIIWTGSEMPFSKEETCLIDERYVVERFEAETWNQGEWNTVISKVGFGVLGSGPDGRFDTGSLHLSKQNATDFMQRGKQEMPSTPPATPPRSKDRLKTQDWVLL